MSRWVVVAVVGASLLACLGSPPPVDAPIDTAEPGKDGVFDDPELPQPDPGQPREPRKGRGDRDRKGGGGGGGGDGDRHGKHKSPGREPPPDTRPEPRPRPDPTTPPRRNGIEFLGDDNWKVERGKVDAWIQNPDGLGATVSQRGNGYALSGVRSGSDAEALGAHDGDLVQKVNGTGLATAADLLAVLNIVKTADDVRVELQRGGSTAVHHYEIED